MVRLTGLSVVAKNDSLNCREFSSYLALLDGVYGRLDPLGYRSYVQASSRQLQIAHIGPGSIELFFPVDLHNYIDPLRWLLIYLFLRTAPSILKGEAAKNWADAAKAGVETYRLLHPVKDTTPHSIDIERRGEATPPLKLNRRQREQIRELIRDDPRFSQLNSRQVRQLIALVEQLLSAERHHLPAAMRFSEQHVIELTLRVRARISGGA